MAEPLTLSLQRAADWFDAAVRERLADGRGLVLSRSQAALLGVLEQERAASVAAVARRLGVTRQSAHRTVHDLASRGLVQVATDAGDARSSDVSLTRVGQAVLRRAAVEQAAVEEELARRIGPRSVAALRAALARDWGPPPTTR